MKVPISKNSFYYFSDKSYKMQKHVMITVIQEIWNSLQI